MKNYFLIISAFYIFAVSSCQKMQVEDKNQNQPTDVSGWLEKNAIIIDANYTNDNGQVGTLYEVTETHQKIFVPRPTKNRPYERVYYKAISYSDGVICCSGTGKCCNLYTNCDGEGFIEINPACWTPR